MMLSGNNDAEVVQKSYK